MKRIARTAAIAALTAYFLTPALMTEQNEGSETIEIESGWQKARGIPSLEASKRTGKCEVCHKLYPEESGSITKYKGSGKLQPKEAMNHCRDCHREEKG